MESGNNFQGLSGLQALQGGLVIPVPGPRLNPDTLFEAIVSYLNGAKGFIKKAAKFDGGWEKWLQAALSVYLSEQVDIIGNVRREVCVYSKSKEKVDEYRLLMNKTKPSTRQVQADLVITPKDTDRNFVVELKCESSTMTKSVKLKAQEKVQQAGTDEQTTAKFQGYVAQGICTDAMKLNMGFEVGQKVDVAAICAVTTSKLVNDAMKSWQFQRPNQQPCYYRAIADSDLAVYMWYVKVSSTGQWVDDGRTPKILSDLRMLRART